MKPCVLSFIGADLLMVDVQAVLHPTSCSVQHHLAEHQLAAPPSCSYADDDDDICSPSKWDFSEDDGSVPFPSNLPVNESGTTSMSMRLWAVAAERAYHERPSIDMLTGRAYWSELNEVRISCCDDGEGRKQLFT